MTIRFASARDIAASPFARVLIQGRVLQAANDNLGWGSHGPMLAEALRHFARHGLGAAKAARNMAEDAWLEGDRAGYEHWLEICRILDRRMALKTSIAVEQGLPRLKP